MMPRFLITGTVTNRLRSDACRWWRAGSARRFRNRAAIFIVLFAMAAAACSGPNTNVPDTPDGFSLEGYWIGDMAELRARGVGSDTVAVFGDAAISFVDGKVALAEGMGNPYETKGPAEALMVTATGRTGKRQMRVRRISDDRIGITLLGIEGVELPEVLYDRALTDEQVQEAKRRLHVVAVEAIRTQAVIVITEVRASLESSFATAGAFPLSAHSTCIDGASGTDTLRETNESDLKLKPFDVAADILVPRHHHSFCYRTTDDGTRFVLVATGHPDGTEELVCVWGDASKTPPVSPIAIIDKQQTKCSLEVAPPPWESDETATPEGTDVP